MTSLLHRITEPTENSPDGMHINKAHPQQLVELDNIGIHKALKILRNRPFKDVKSLTRLKGIGEKTRPKSMGEYLKEKTGSLTELAPKWSEREHLIEALRTHLQDAQPSLDADTEQKELVDLGLILDAYRASQVPTDSQLLKDRLNKFQQYADAPSLAKTAKIVDPTILKSVLRGARKTVEETSREVPSIAAGADLLFSEMPEGVNKAKHIVGLVEDSRAQALHRILQLLTEPQVKMGSHTLKEILGYKTASESRRIKGEEIISKGVPGVLADFIFSGGSGQRQH